MKVTVIRGAQHARPWEGIRHSAQALGTGIATAENNPWAQAQSPAGVSFHGLVKKGLYPNTSQSFDCGTP